MALWSELNVITRHLVICSVKPAASNPGLCWTKCTKFHLTELLRMTVCFEKCVLLSQNTFFNVSARYIPRIIRPVLAKDTSNIYAHHKGAPGAGSSMVDSSLLRNILFSCGEGRILVGEVFVESGCPLTMRSPLIVNLTFRLCYYCMIWRFYNVCRFFKITVIQCTFLLL